ncbi:MAG: class I SAM-dependent methyltransferase, partial [Betaproteobacteria bacterium]
AWIAVPADADWADVGCGTGALSEAIFATARPASIQGFDPSAGFLRFAQRRLSHAAVTFAVADARSLPLAHASVDAAVAGLVINFVPDPSSAVREMARVTRPGGTVAAYVWDYGDKMELMRRFWDAAVALDPAAEALDEGRRFPMCRPGPLQELFDGAELRDVATQPIDIATNFAGFDDFWSPFLGGQGPAPAYAMSLAADRRDALRERIRATLPMRDDGSIHLLARAWAVRARKRE